MKIVLLGIGVVTLDAKRLPDEPLSLYTMSLAFLLPAGNDILRKFISFLFNFVCVDFGLILDENRSKSRKDAEK